MSIDPIDKWLDALHFENQRLSFRPNPMYVEILEEQIRKLESTPLDVAAGYELDEILQNLQSLKQDLASVKQLLSFAERLQNLRTQMRESGPLQYSPDEAEEVMNGFNAYFQKAKIDQRNRQRQHLASLWQFGPQADAVRRRRIVQLFKTYAKRRLMWGGMNLLLTGPLRLGLGVIKLSKNAK